MRPAGSPAGAPTMTANERDPGREPYRRVRLVRAVLAILVSLLTILEYLGAL